LVTARSVKRRRLLGCRSTGWAVISQAGRRLRNAAPCCLRHCEQWQFSGLSNGPVISNAMPPHRQLPRIIQQVVEHFAVNYIS
jgi:hypothetical protein